MKNLYCTIPVCGYVGSMNWQQFLPLVIVLGVAVVFVWRSSGEKKHRPSCGCGCEHDHAAETKKEKTAR